MILPTHSAEASKKRMNHKIYQSIKKDRQRYG